MNKTGGPSTFSSPSPSAFEKGDRGDKGDKGDRGAFPFPSSPSNPYERDGDFIMDAGKRDGRDGGYGRDGGMPASERRMSSDVPDSRSRVEVSDVAL